MSVGQTRGMQPGNRALPSALAGAIDLSAIKARADAASRPAPPAGAESAAAGGSGSEHSVNVTEASFQADVVERSLQVPVVLDLWAEWCEPCKQLGPVLEKLAAEGAGAWALAKIDVDANPRIAQALGVQGIPAVKAIFQGQIVAEFTGALPEPEVRKWIASLVEAIGASMPPDGQADPEAVAAAQAEADAKYSPVEDAVARGDFAAARTSLERLLADAPADETAAAMLRQVQLLDRTSTVPQDAVARADAAPGDLAAQLAAADIEVLDDAPDRAFERLLNVVRRTAGDARNAARERLVELFAVVGDDDPRVGAARRALSTALF